MIFTGYFGGMDAIHPSRRLVSIARKPPEGIRIESYPALFPSVELLGDYQRGGVSPEAYEARYRAETLDPLNPADLKRDLDGAVLLCYENPEDFCHRKVLRRWLAEHGLLALEYRRGYGIAVVGSRGYDNYSEFSSILSSLLASFDEGQRIALVSGGANGADSLCERFAAEHEVEVRVHPADWKRLGRRAGYARNEAIWDDSDLGIAFWDGSSPGTAHSIDLAGRQHKPLVVYDYVRKHYTVHLNLLLVSGQAALF